MAPIVSIACVVALTACTRHYSLREFDALARTSQARTIVLEETFSLYSPFELPLTLEYVPIVAAQQTEVFALFGVESAAPIPVKLRANAGMGLDFRIEGDQFILNGISMEPHGGFLGQAGGNVVVIEVAPAQRSVRPDGTPHVTVMGASMYRDTIRHEFAHVATNLLGLPAGNWLGEGLAHAVEWLPLEDGRFVLEPVPERLRQAASLPRELRDVASLLAWEQGLPPAQRDTEVRVLAFSLVTFLLEQEPGPSFRARILEVARRSRAELLAAEPAWRIWLEALAAAP